MLEDNISQVSSSPFHSTLFHIFLPSNFSKPCPLSFVGCWLIYLTSSTHFLSSKLAIFHVLACILSVGLLLHFYSYFSCTPIKLIVFFPFSLLEEKFSDQQGENRWPGRTVLGKELRWYIESRTGQIQLQGFESLPPDDSKKTWPAQNYKTLLEFLYIYSWHFNPNLIPQSRWWKNFLIYLRWIPIHHLLFPQDCGSWSSISTIILV